MVSCPYPPEIEDPEELLGRYRGLVRWAESLVDAGAGEVTVVQRFHRALSMRRNEVRYRFVAGGPSGSVPPWRTGGRLAGVVAAIGADVVHVDGMVFPVLVRHIRARLSRRTALVVQDHGGIHDDSPGFRSWRWRTLYRFGLRAADGFMFTARALAAPWLRAGIIGDRQTIYEVVEAGTDHPPPPLSLDSDGSDGGGSLSPDLPGRPALLWVGRLDGNKDPLTVLEGFERAATVLPYAALTMVFSDDQLLSAVRDRITNSPTLAPRVHLLGRLEHAALGRLYASADFFVLGSHHEGSGYALMEALSFGVTPIVTDIPAFRALTDEGRVGALFPVGAASMMASALISSSAHDASARRRLVRAHFDRVLGWSAVGRSALAAYRQASTRRRLS